MRISSVLEKFNVFRFLFPEGGILCIYLEPVRTYGRKRKGAHKNKPKKTKNKKNISEDIRYIHISEKIILVKRSNENRDRIEKYWKLRKTIEKNGIEKGNWKGNQQKRNLAKEKRLKTVEKKAGPSSGQFRFAVVWSFLSCFCHRSIPHWQLCYGWFTAIAEIFGNNRHSIRRGLVFLIVLLFLLFLILVTLLWLIHRESRYLRELTRRRPWKKREQNKMKEKEEKSHLVEVVIDARVICHMI